jgi:DNA-binding Lrp family transcriptional regulator
MGEEDRQDATRTDRAATERATMHVSRRLTVSEAADELGISAEAVRSRVKRGTLRSIKEGGTVYVLLPAPVEDDQTTTGRAQTDTRAEPGHDRTADQTSTRADLREELVESLLDQVAYMREQLAEEREARRRADTIIAQLTQANAEQARTIRELEPSPTPETRDARETPTEVDGGTGTPVGDAGQSRRSSWWRRFFGFE